MTNLQDTDITTSSNGAVSTRAALVAIDRNSWSRSVGMLGRDRRNAHDGALDVIATDHAPHHPDEKARAIDDIWKGPGGFPGVQTFLPLMLKLVEEGVLDYPRLVQICCATPARVFGLYPRKGSLQIGSDADFVIVDPSRPMTIRNQDQFSKARNVPFDGMTA
ncbi:MAG TPA: dihydroorotase family protein, partial [Xanthobacteraceae bacterium]|nr:dihydroorotase family protein [Xanthobacteraceae bacterium]